MEACNPLTRMNSTGLSVYQPTPQLLFSTAYDITAGAAAAFKISAVELDPEPTVLERRVLLLLRTGRRSLDRRMRPGWYGEVEHAEQR